MGGVCWSQPYSWRVAALLRVKWTICWMANSNSGGEPLATASEDGLVDAFDTFASAFGSVDLDGLENLDGFDDPIEDAVAFYFSPTFRASPSSLFIISQLSIEEQGNVAAFLRVVNSATNIDEVHKRVQYIRKVRSAGNTDLLKIAIADTRDARTVLSEKQLSADVQQQLSAAETQLNAALKAKDRDRPSVMRKVLTLLDEARAALFSDTPPDPGSGSGGSAGGSGDAAGGVGVPVEGGAPSAGTSASGGSGTAGSPPIPPVDAEF